MLVSVHINSVIRVRLTELGEQILQTRHVGLMLRVIQAGGTPYPYKSHTNKEGWTPFMLWELIQIFGPYCSMGTQPPFQTELRVEADYEV